MISAQVPPQIGDALFAKSIPAHVCSHVGRTKDELGVSTLTPYRDGNVTKLLVEGSKPRYTRYGVFFFRGRRVVAVYARQAQVLCNTSSRTIGAEWTL